MQTLGCLNLALRRYRSFTDQKKFKLSMNTNKLDSLISRGLSLSELSMMANNMFGKIFFMEYAVNLLYATFGAYFSTSIIYVYDSELGRINQLILILSMFNIAQAVFSTYRVHLMQNQGQKMCDQFYAIKKNLEDVCVTSSKNLDSEDAKKLDVLISRFAETSPIRPCGVFDMNAANFVSIGGIILTYLVVLLQFKFSAEKDENRFSLNFEDMPALLGNSTLDEFMAFLDNNDRTLTDWRFFLSNKTSD